MDESAQATGTRAHRLRESHRQAPPSPVPTAPAPSRHKQRCGEAAPCDPDRSSALPYRRWRCLRIFGETRDSGRAVRKSEGCGLPSIAAGP